MEVLRCAVALPFKIDTPLINHCLPAYINGFPLYTQIF